MISVLNRGHLFYAGVVESFASFSLHIARRTLALKILEYVPIIIPRIIASTKSFVVDPPKKYKARSVINIVKEVFILLARV